MAEKRFFWIKLMDDFLWGDKVKFLMRQKNGSDYVVMYLMLCSLAKNSNGRLVKQLGNILIQLDVDTIYGELNGYFKYDTIVVAMGLFSQLDLIYQEVGDGVFIIKNFDNMVGSECASAARVRRLRENARNEQQLDPPLQSNELPLKGNDIDVTQPLQSNKNSVTSALQSPLHCNCRVKSIELDNLVGKDRITKCVNNACAYTQSQDLFEKEITTIIDALTLGCNNKPERYAGKIRDTQYWLGVLEDDDLSAIISYAVNTLKLYTPEDDKLRYVLAVIARKMDEIRKRRNESNGN